MRLKEALIGKIPKSKMEFVPNTFDIIGDIAIVEIVPQLEKYERKIGTGLLELHKNIKVVCKKHGIHKGVYRRQEYRILAGERRKTTVHRENKVKLNLHIEKTYFSGRTATERLRIAGLVKKGERVLVMFGGVAPFALVIAKNSDAGEVVSVELNPEAHKFAISNIHANKARNVECLKGDVRQVVPSLGKFDRVLMPLPKNAESYLDVALRAAKKGGMIHFYDFGMDEEIVGIKKVIKDICKREKKTCKFVRVVKCGQFSPRVNRLCVDFKVSS